MFLNKMRGLSLELMSAEFYQKSYPWKALWSIAEKTWQALLWAWLPAGAQSKPLLWMNGARREVGVCFPAFSLRS
jgi:hypothetical protein